MLDNLNESPKHACDVFAMQCGEQNSLSAIIAAFEKSGFRRVRKEKNYASLPRFLSPTPFSLLCLLTNPRPC